MLIVRIRENLDFGASLYQCFADLNPKSWSVQPTQRSSKVTDSFLVVGAGLMELMAFRAPTPPRALWRASKSPIGRATTSTGERAHIPHGGRRNMRCVSRADLLRAFRVLQGAFFFEFIYGAFLLRSKFLTSCAFAPTGPWGGRVYYPSAYGTTHYVRARRDSETPGRGRVLRRREQGDEAADWRDVKLK